MGGPATEATTIDAIGAWVSGLRLDAIPARVVEKARLQQASVLAAALGARVSRAAAKVLASVRRRGERATSPASEGRIVATGERAPLHAAVFANAACSCAFDWDEVVLIGHPGHSAGLVPLVLAAARRASLGDAIVAQVAANEVAGRLGLATFFRPQNGQHLPSIHCAGAAAAAARLFELDARATAEAIAIALAQPPTPLWPSFLGPIDAKVLTAAHAAEIGLAAAELAREGATGARDILDHPKGFFRRFAFVAVRNAFGGLGRAWLTDTLCVKLHAGCWYFQTALDAAEELRGELARTGEPLPLEARRVRRIEARVPLLAAAVNALSADRQVCGADLTENDVNFSLATSLALLLSGDAPRLVPDDLTVGALAARAPAVRALAAKVEVVHDLGATRTLLAAVDEAVDLVGLLAGITNRDLVRALGRARGEFGGRAGGLAVRDLFAGVRAFAGALFRRLRGAGRRYDLGDRGGSLAGFAMPLVARVAVELEGGRTLVAERAVPRGALDDLARARPEVLWKLAHALALAAVPDAPDRARAIVETPLDAEAAAILDLVASSRNPEPETEAAWTG